MAEIFGVPNMNPDDFQKNMSNTSSDDKNSIVGLFGKLSEVVELLKTNNTQEKKILEVLMGSASKKTNEKLKSSNNSASEMAINENTLAINKLSELIKTATIKYEINGNGANFFTKLLIASTSDKKIRAVDAFGRVFGNMVERIGKLSKYSEPIEKLGKSLMYFFSSAKQIGKGLMLASAGIALFGLSIITFMQAITFDDLVLFVGIMGAIRLGSELLKGAKWNFAMASASIALLGLSIWAFTELIDLKLATDFALSLAMVGGAMWVFSKIAGGFASMSKSLIVSAVAIGAIGGSLWVFNKALADMNDFDLMVAGKTLLFVGASATLLNFIGKQAVNIGIGAVASATVAGALWALAKGVQAFANVDIDPEKMTRTAIASGLAIGVLALIGASTPVALAIGVGALASATVGGALWALAQGLKAIGTVNITPEQGANFANAVGEGVKGLALVAMNAIGIGIATPLAIGMGGALWALSKGINSIMKMPTIDPLKIALFGKSVGLLMDVFNPQGSIVGNFFKNVGRTLNTVMYTGIASITIALATALQVATFLIPSQSRIEELTTNLGFFVSEISKVFDPKKHDFGAIKNGIASFIGISNLAKDIGDTVYSLGNLTFETKEFRNGKYVVTGSRTLNSSDFQKVGTSIGQMLNALTDPLMKIGSAKDTYSIGGYTVTNPFSNKVKSGIDAMANIGKIFTPLTNVINSFAKNGIDARFVKAFNYNLSSIIGGIGQAFVSNEKDLKKANKMELANVTGAVKTLSVIIGNNQFANNMPKFKTFTGDVVKLKTTLNELNVDRLTKFNVMLQNINEMAKNGAMQQLVETFGDFIDKFIEFTENQKKAREEAQAQQMWQSPQTSTPNMFAPNLPTQKIIPSSTPQQQVIQTPKGNELTIQDLRKLFTSGDVRVQVENLKDIKFN